VSFVAAECESASVSAPDIAHRPDVPWKGRRAIIFGSALCSIKRSGSGFIKMVSSSSRRGSKIQNQKPSESPSDLAKRFLELEQLRSRFLELQQLRKQVRELEHLAAMARQRARRARTDGASRRK
jgi:hypothetical protein